MKTFTLEQIAQVAGGMLSKAKDVAITKIAPPLIADENTLALALSEEEIANLSKTKASAALVPLGVNIDGFSTIEVERPRLAMMKLITMFYEEPHVNSGIHPSATVHPSVCIGDRVKVGNKVILHHGVSLGADGFSFVTENPNNIEQARKDGEIKENNVEQVIFKIPSIGSVEIGNNVEIGANTAIDRGTIENTVIGDNTKIDDLVMIGHNCRIGKGCMIVSQVGIAGSCVIGDRVVIAGQAGLADHISIGDDTIIAAQAGVTKSFPEKSIVVGAPAVPRKEFIKQLKIMKDAGDLIAKFKKYEPLLKSFEEGAAEN